MLTDSPQQASSPDRTKRSSNFSLAQVILITIAAILIVYDGFEVAERVWFRQPGNELFERLRAFFSVLAVVAVASWAVLRRSPPLFSPSAATPRLPVHHDDDERIAHYANWFIRMRWVAVLTALLLVFFAIYVVQQLPADNWLLLVITIAVLASMNFTYSAMLKAHIGLGILLPLQAYGDLVVLIQLLHYAGGVENPLSMLLLFHVIIGGIVLSRRQCYWVAATASALFALLVYAEGTGLVNHYTLLSFPHFHGPGGVYHAAHDVRFALSAVIVQTSILFLTAFFTTTMTERLRRDEVQLEVFTDRILAQTQMLERALETTRTGLCVCDQNLQCEWCNTRWKTWLADRADPDCAGVTCDDGSTPALATLSDGVIRQSDVTFHNLRNTDGAPTVLQLTTAPLLDKDGVTTHVVQLGQDVTAQKQIQARILQAEKLAAVGELAGKVAHEVNNPIAIISAKTRLMMSDPQNPLPQKSLDELCKIADLTDRVARTAQGLLSYCRPVAGPAAVLDIRDTLRKALAVVDVPAAAAGVRLECHLPDTPCEIVVNASELEQVFLNIFLNALDAMPQGGRLAASAQLTHPADVNVASHVELVIEDDGCGIPTEIREHVFEPFVTTKTDGRGTGLGLSICLGLVRSNGGEIMLDSEPGAGTRVRLRFPLVTAPKMAVAHG